MADIYVKPRTSIPRGSVLMAPVFVICTIGAIVVFFVCGWGEEVVARAKKIFGKKTAE